MKNGTKRMLLNSYRPLVVYALLDQLVKCQAFTIKTREPVPPFLPLLPPTSLYPVLPFTVFPQSAISISTSSPSNLPLSWLPFTVIPL